ncbi:hypothetical protein [Mollivirus kamchatka]|nr:hypothetical protein [Mollivirus kamchatka]
MDTMDRDHDNRDLPLVSLCDDALSAVLCCSSPTNGYLLSVYDYKRLALTCRDMARRLLSADGIESLLGRRIGGAKSPRSLALHAVAEEALAVSSVFVRGISLLTRTGQVPYRSLVSCLCVVIADRHGCEHDIAPLFAREPDSKLDLGIMASTLADRLLLAIRHGLLKTSAVFLRALGELTRLTNSAYSYDGTRFNISISDQLDQCLRSVMGFNLGQVTRMRPFIDHDRAPDITKDGIMDSSLTPHMAELAAIGVGRAELLRPIARAESFLAHQLARAFWRSPLVSPTVVGLATNAEPFDCCCRFTRGLAHEPDGIGVTMARGICDDTRRRGQACRRLFETIADSVADPYLKQASMDKVLIPWLSNDITVPSEDSRLVVRNVLILNDIINRGLTALPATSRSCYDENGCFGTVEDLCDLVVDIQRLTDQCDQVHPWHRTSQRLSVCQSNMDPGMTNYLILTFVSRVTTRREFERAVDRPSRRYWNTLLPSFVRAMTREEESLAMLATISIYVALHDRIAYEIDVNLNGALFVYSQSTTTTDTSPQDQNMSTVDIDEIGSLFNKLLHVLVTTLRGFDVAQPEQSVSKCLDNIRKTIHLTVLEALASRVDLSGCLFSSDRLSPLFKVKVIALLLGIANLRPEAHDAAWIAQARSMYSAMAASSL